MSDIPRARARLIKLLDYDDLSLFVRKEITAVLRLLKRERPEFKAPRKLPSLTGQQVEFCRMLRSNGLPLNEIARKLGTNIGRVSEAINGKRNGI